MLSVIVDRKWTPVTMQKRKINFYLRAATSAVVLHLPCVREEIDGRFLMVEFDWVVFERPPLALHTIQTCVEVLSKAGTISHYPLEDERPVGRGNKVKWMESWKHDRFKSRVLLSLIRTLDRDYIPANGPANG